MKEKNLDKTNRQNDNEIETPKGIKALLWIFNEKNPGIKLIVKRIKKAEDKI